MARIFFGSVQEVYLNSFLKGIAADAVKNDTHFITYYHAVVRWMLQQVRPMKEAICREYFINKSTVQYAGNFETLIVGNKQYKVPNGELN